MIAFATPWALVGLVAALVPVLLHLFARREPPTVEFPAVRYLSETARVHQRRLNLEHWLLLLARTLLIVLLVLAAAGPTSPRGGAGTHAPTAMVVILDNSLSSGVTAGGVPAIDGLKKAARGILDRATADDRLWLVTTDGLARRGSREELKQIADTLRPSAFRLDLGEAIGLARDVLSGETMPGEVMVVSDLQASALTPARGTGAVTVAAPEGPIVANAGIAAVDAGAQPWTADGGAITVHLVGADTTGVPVSVRLGARRTRQALAAPTRPVTLPMVVQDRGWVPLDVELAPDELRGDDSWSTVVRVAPAARVRWDGGDRYLAAAFDVLRDGGRVVPGADLTVGSLGPGASLVLPPADPAQVGAVNRALAGRGVTWQFGALVTVPAVTDSTALLGSERLTRRYELKSAGSGETGVLLRAGGAPWLVRTGDIVLVGSRFDPAWTSLPLSARFVPLLDALVNRIVRGEIAALAAAPGDPVQVPDRTDHVAAPGRTVTVEGGALFRPISTGLHFLLAGQDTIGVLSVNPDPRESDLTRAGSRNVTSLWKGSRVVALDDGANAAFTAASRGDLRGPFLWTALVLGVLEAGLAAGRRRAHDSGRSA
ncbi:MAG TPA: BatA domain-containing protein [Gemmatimonadales bacterium]|nr:BatA domain-containing protein [Gemmatimonadales bacterium]